MTERDTLPRSLFVSSLHRKNTCFSMRKRMVRSQARNYCFTLNNYNEDEVEALKTIEHKYMVIGKEVGEQGTPHLQGYIEFYKPKDMSALKKVNERIHWERRLGTAREAAAYCKKESNFYEHGEISRQGERTDLKRVATMVREKKTLKEIAEECPVEYIKYNRGICALIASAREPRSLDSPPVVLWLWGKTGVGKTRWAFDKHGNNVYIKDGTQWWDGYTQQEAIIIDDFDGKWPVRDLLRLLDRYPYQGQTKGGYVQINSPYIYVTSDSKPKTYWNTAIWSQMKRRIWLVINLQ